MGRFSTRAIVVACVFGLFSIVAVGGAILGRVEGSGFIEGMWLAFNVVATTGFGEGPATIGGQLFLMVLFGAAALCWFGLVVVAIEVANLRLQTHMLTNEALRPLGRRPRSRLFHDN